MPFNAALQFCDPSFAHRLLLLVDEDANGSVSWLPPFLKGAQFSIHDEHKFVVFVEGVDCSTSVFMSWLRASILSAPCHRIYILGENAEPTFEGIAARLRERAPSFAGAGVRLLVFPKKLEAELGEAVCEVLDLQPRDFRHLIFVVRLPGGRGYRWHAVTAEEYGGPCLAPTPLQVLQLGSVVASAVAKVHEAYGLAGGKPLGESDVVIDIGASPGSWTAYAAAVLRVGTVVAVDPADIDPAVLALPGVAHVRQLSHNAAPAVAQLLGGRQADALLCDMNKHPGEVPGMLAGVLPMLRPGALLVITLKFVGKGWERGGFFERLRRESAGYASDVRFLWLMANTATERTMVARYTPQQQPQPLPSSIHGCAAVAAGDEQQQQQQHVEQPLMEGPPAQQPVGT